jgi:hypothetical protein
VDLHRIGELRSRAYHRTIAARLDAEMVSRVRDRVALLRVREQLDPRLADRWEQVLALPISDLAVRLDADDEEMRRLRSASPFAGELSPRERWELWREVRRDARAT